MSENNGDRRPDGYGPSADGENQAPNHPSSADSANAEQWGNQDTQSFQPGQGYGQDTQSFPPGQPYGQSTQPFQPGQGYAQDTQAFQPEGQGYPYGQGAYTPQDTQAFGQQPGYGAPGYGAENQAYGADQYGQQGYTQQYGQQNYVQGAQPGSYQSSYGGYDGSGGGYPPYGGGYGQQPPKGKGPLIAWIVLGIILVAAIVVGILFGTGFFDDDEKDEPTPTATETLTVTPTIDGPTSPPTIDDPTSPPTTEIETPGTSGSYGDDPELDALWDECAEGDMAACDDLWFAAEYGTEYYEFANTCGETTDSAFGFCDSGTATSGESYGDDAELDELWDACEGGDYKACDDLWWDSPIGSEYEQFAGTCGERTEYSSGMCEFKDETDQF